LTVSLLKAQGADAAVAATSVATASDIIVAAGSRTEMGAAYANGPLNIAYANVKLDAYSTEKKRATNTLVANYNLGAATVYVGAVSGDLLSDTTAATTTKGSSASIKYTIGQIDLLAGLNQRKDSGSDAQKVTGLRADYNFSKTTASYVAYENFKAATAANDQKLVSIGLRKSF
jgi:predicted porin